MGVTGHADDRLVEGQVPYVGDTPLGVTEGVHLAPGVDQKVAPPA